LINTACSLAIVRRKTIRAEEMKRKRSADEMQDATRVNRRKIAHK